MNSKILYGAAFSALLLTACSQDSVLDMPVPNNDAIAYGVTSGNTTRAVQSLCNTSMPKNFKVSAYKTGTTENYFAKDVQNLVEGSNPAKYEGEVRYWPDYKLDFHAWANDQDTYSYNEVEKSGKFENFTPKSDAKDQVDLVYASMPGQDRGNTVKLNFRHALSQIVFNARNESGLDISISGVKVANVNTVGTYIMKNSDTSDNYENHPEDPSVEDNRKGMGEWNDVATSVLGVYTTTFNPVAIEGTENVTLTDADHKGNADGSLLLLPQKQDAWDPTTPAQEFIGSYFLVNVKISDPNNGDKVIWDRETAVPVNIDWKQGVRYRYTFVFTGKTGGGYVPDPVDPKPVINGIELEVKTDDFVPADGSELPGQGDTEEPTPEVKKYSYTVNYDANGGTGNMTADSKVEIETASYNSTAKENAFTRENYTFSGWNTKADGTGTAYAANAQIPMTGVENQNVEVTLYAQWTANPRTITLTYNDNGGDNNAPAPVVKNVTGNESVSIDITDKIPSKNNGDGYVFLGWSTKQVTSGATRADVEYMVAGNKYEKQSSISISKDTVLYAVWGEAGTDFEINPKPSEGENE